MDREMDDPEGGTIVKDGGEDANVMGGGSHRSPGMPVQTGKVLTAYYQRRKDGY